MANQPCKNHVKNQPCRWLPCQRCSDRGQSCSPHLLFHWKKSFFSPLKKYWEMQREINFFFLRQLIYGQLGEIISLFRDKAFHVFNYLISFHFLLAISEREGQACKLSQIIQDDKLPHLIKCVFVSNCMLYLLQITKCICFQMTNWICLKWQIEFVSNYKLYLYQMLSPLFMLSGRRICKMYLSLIANCICLKLQIVFVTNAFPPYHALWSEEMQNVFVSNRKVHLSQITSFICIKCKLHLSQIVKCICLKLQIVFVSNAFPVFTLSCSLVERAAGKFQFGSVGKNKLLKIFWNISLNYPESFLSHTVWCI